MRRTKKQIRQLREEINRLAQVGYSFNEIAKLLKLKSHQLANYHFLQYRKLSTSEGLQTISKIK